MKRWIQGGILALLCSTAPVMAEIKGEAVAYQSDGVTLKGYLAYDDSITGKRPGVLVVHEWWGHNEYARKRARMLAELGYTALAIDMYGDGKTADHPDNAKAFMMEVLNNIEAGRARFMAAKTALETHSSVNKDKLAAVGYCFGGGTALAMMRMGVELDGVASFHGSLGTDISVEKGTIATRVAVFTGGKDPMIPAKQVKAFEAEMKEAEIDYQLVVYPEAKHSFTNPDADKFGKKFKMPLAYDENADKDSWQKLQVFLKDIFN
ncbi:dienelactone hydrolase family protein [Candidatus Venteria ishoeyi]|uniref:Carboxymethylenebutenolidase n=1 Tax=Candidatus Venteria ishoeyi TaxID=1899563 RepID=A0A1H6FDM5_9GAMM|nr:dienelactone hydrolase family protein [Candidatus Venteria ishoeyi]SEH07135.1 Carboxymethylenebutenolidase [Candidatus Venteria ishoeyi]